MKKLIVYIMLMCSSAMAVEYGYFARNSTEDSWSDDGEIILYDGDIFVYLSDNHTQYEDGNFCRFYVDIAGLSRKTILIKAFTHSSEGVFYYPQDARSLSGPCTITLLSDRSETCLLYTSDAADE